MFLHASVSNLVTCGDNNVLSCIVLIVDMSLMIENKVFKREHSTKKVLRKLVFKETILCK